MATEEGASGGGIARRLLLVALALAAVGDGTAETVMADVSGGSTQRLLDLADRRGRLPLIVGLAVDRADDEAAIKRAQQQLLADLGVTIGRDGALAGPGITGVKLYDTIPFIALTADAEAIQRITRHPLVVSIQEDSALPPTE